MLLELAALATQVTRADQSYQAGIAVTRQALEQERADGRGIVELLSRSVPTAPATPGLGERLDLLA
jgi:hypothetical protein